MGHVDRRRAFTLVELLIVITVSVMLAALILPLYRAEKERAAGNRCMDNLKQIGVGMKLYGVDWGGRFPIAGEGGDGSGKPGVCRLFLALKPYIAGDNMLFVCPADTGDKMIGGSPTPYYSAMFYSSYAWPAGYNWVNGLSQDNPVPPGGARNWVDRLPVSRRPALFDHRPWHRGTADQSTSWVVPTTTIDNVLFCDGHVGYATWSWLVACMMPGGAEPPGGP